MVEIARRLRNQGLQVQSPLSARGYDLLINGRMRIAFRVASARVRTHQVTVRGQTYIYTYAVWQFNLGSEDTEKNADIVVCIALDDDSSVRGEEFVIPRDKINARSFSLHRGRKPYRGQYAEYHNLWEPVLCVAPAEPAQSDDVLCY